MKLLLLECPKCGGNLEVKGDRDTIFCEYCGSKILIKHSKAEKEALEKSKREKTAREKTELEFERKKREIEELEKQANLRTTSNKKNGDDSLVKLIVVIAIIGVFCSILIPAIIGFNSENHTDNEPITKNLTIQNFTFALPDYYEEEDSDKDTKNFYAENDEKVVILNISYPKETDKKYDVSYDGLYADNDNMIKSFEKTYKDCGVYSNETYENKNGVKGILYRFNYVQKISFLQKEDATGYCFVFPSEDDRRWFYVTFLCTNNVTNDDYEEDYWDLLESIEMTGSKVKETK